MFHLSLPVRHFEECLAFYRDCFSAEVRMLSSDTANVFVFGGQVTLHDRPSIDFSDEVQRAMHFGQVVSPEEWLRLLDRLIAAGHSPLRSIMPSEIANRRGKFVVADPSGYLVEINSTTPLE